MNWIKRNPQPVVAAIFAVLCFVSLAWTGQWQAKKYDGTPLGLFVADGDTVTTGFLEADTARVDTIYGKRAHFLRAWIDTLDGDTLNLGHVHIDTLSTDSLTALVCYIDTLNGDTMWFTSASLVHLYSAIAQIEQLEVEDSLWVPAGGVAALSRAEIDTAHAKLLEVESAGDARGYGWFENYTLTSDTNYWGLWGGFYKTAGASDQSDYINACQFDAVMNQADGVIGGIYGMSGIGELAAGQMGTPDTSRYLMGGEMRTNATGGILYGSMVGMLNEAISYDGVDSIAGDQIGLWVFTHANHVGGATYGVLLDDSTGTDWGIYQTGSSPNYLWGLELGDSLTVAGNIHAANIYADTVYGDGSNLTGIAGGDTSGLRAEWRGDIGDTATALRGEMADYLPLADFDDSLLAVYADTISVSVHDTAETVRDSLAAVAAAAVTAVLDTTPKGLGITGVYFSSLPIRSTRAAVSGALCGGDGYLFMAGVANNLRSFSITDGVLSASPVDSLADDAVDCFYLNGALYTTNNLKGYRYSVTAGEMAKVDSVTLPDNGQGICGVQYQDSTWIYISDDDGQVNTCSAAGANDLTLKTTKVANNAGIGYNVWAVENRVYLANGTYGLYTFTNSAGTLTQTDNDDLGAHSIVSVTGNVDGTRMWMMARAEGVFELEVSGNTVTPKSWAWDPGNTNSSVYWFTGGSESGVYATFDDPTVAIVRLTNGLYDFNESAFTAATGTGTWMGQDLWDDGEYLYFHTGSNLYTFAPKAPIAYRANVDTLFVETELAVDVDGSPAAHGYPFGVYSGAAYSRIESAGGSLVTSSSKALKDADPPFTDAVGVAVLELLDRLPLQRWRYKSQTNRGQHVGAMAEDWYPVARLVAPEAADSTQISQEHQSAALLLAVQELSRRNKRLEARVDSMEGLMPGRGKHLRERPSIHRDKPVRPAPSPRPSKAGRQ